MNRQQALQQLLRPLKVYSPLSVAASRTDLHKRRRDLRIVYPFLLESEKEWVKKWCKENDLKI